jgi:hypothetical protein
MKLYNLSNHTINVHQREQIADLLKREGETLDEIVQIPVFLDPDMAFEPQVKQLLERLPKQELFLLIPPGMNIIAYLMAQKFAHQGRRIPVVRLQRVEKEDFTAHDVAEIIW